MPDEKPPSPIDPFQALLAKQQETLDKLNEAFAAIDARAAAEKRAVLEKYGMPGAIDVLPKPGQYATIVPMDASESLRKPKNSVSGPTPTSKGPFQGLRARMLTQGINISVAKIARDIGVSANSARSWDARVALGYAVPDHVLAKLAKYELEEIARRKRAAKQ